MSHPYLSLKNITIDPLLAQRIPRHLAYYHLALPVAEDEDMITLVMVHPDNKNVCGLFEETLGVKVFPVQGDSREIAATLDLLYPDDGAIRVPRLLSWSATQPEEVLTYARQIASGLSDKAVCLDASANSLDSVLSIAQDYTLAVIDTRQNTMMGDLLRKSNTSLLLIRGDMLPIHRVLVALHGHSPDKRTIEMVKPLADSVTLLGVAAPTKRHDIYGVATLLHPSTLASAHIAECADLLPPTLESWLRLRQGLPFEQIAAEFTEGDYDLLAIAVETYGAFVHKIIQGVQNGKPILAVKPKG